MPFELHFFPKPAVLIRAVCCSLHCFHQCVSVFTRTNLLMFESEMSDPTSCHLQREEDHCESQYSHLLMSVVWKPQKDFFLLGQDMFSLLKIIITHPHVQTKARLHLLQSSDECLNHTFVCVISSRHACWWMGTSRLFCIALPRHCHVGPVSSIVTQR